MLSKGHAVAAVAATSPHLAEEALALIQVEYEELPPVLTAAEAMKPGAPLLHARLASLTSGVGETSVIPPLVAITNAVYHAIGVRLNQLPLSPARILEALWEKAAAAHGTHAQ